MLSSINNLMRIFPVLVAIASIQVTIQISIAIVQNQNEDTYPGHHCVMQSSNPQLLTVQKEDEKEEGQTVPPKSNS
ncbi:hypothetical protein [Spirulina sp. 06S082]|uniref:hypothetical protein n=1 Tax=Spirulina sp. 06S082 TaxID=3110248 RepID=UPI002B20E093|nr:hypothetical protein [Spirulina sp. 06S082]MEA5470657.1 hypothetical protein [Spirulina sp. 06S082]